MSQRLGARGMSHVVLERGDRAGWSWEHTYDSLRLHTGKHMSSLPGMAFPAGTPLFPSRGEFVEYLTRYVDRFRLPVRTGLEATGLAREGDGWELETTGGTFRSRAVVVATGIMSSPLVPSFEGLASYEGRVLHSREYRRPEQIPGRTVLVVGIGNSAAEIASELAGAGREVALSVRSGASVFPRSVAGIPSQYLGWPISWLPATVQLKIVRGSGQLGGFVRRGSTGLPRKVNLDVCNFQPVIGGGILRHIRAGRIRVVSGVSEFSGDGALLADGSLWRGDAVILATGFSAAMDWMGEFGSRDECGFGERRDRVRSKDHPGLYFVGHNYTAPGTIHNIRTDSGRISRLIAGSQRQ